MLLGGAGDWEQSGYILPISKNPLQLFHTPLQ
jgi:hypothetical protein